MKQANKRRIIGETILGIVFLIAIIGLILVASILEMNISLRIVIIVSSFILMLIGLVGLILIDCYTGYYECPKCHERFIPSIRAYIFGAHTIKKRHLKCPKCGEKSWCVKKMSKKDD